MNKEITYNIVNSLLAGGLVMLGGFSTGEITWNAFCFALIAGLAVAVTQFKEYWTTKQKDYKCRLFNFI